MGGEIEKQMLAAFREQYADKRTKILNLLKGGQLSQIGADGILEQLDQEEQGAVTFTQSKENIAELRCQCIADNLEKIRQ